MLKYDVVNPLDDAHILTLYQMLAERTPEQAISHREMPPFQDHARFVANHPYKLWLLLRSDEEWVGNVYLTRQNEIGIHISDGHRGKGYGREAITILRHLYDGPFYANINPENKASIAFFTRLGATHIQQTYRLM